MPLLSNSTMSIIINQVYGTVVLLLLTVVRCALRAHKMIAVQMIQLPLYDISFLRR